MIYIYDVIYMGKILTTPSLWIGFSWTNWIGIKFDKDIPIVVSNEKVITSLYDLSVNLPEICSFRTPKQMKADTRNLFKFLESVKQISQWLDPVEFLHNIYYWKGIELWLKDMLFRLKNSWIKIWYSTLYKYLTKYFLWELADKWRQNQSKNRAKSLPWWKWWAWLINLKRKELIEEKFDKLAIIVENSKDRVWKILLDNIPEKYKVDKVAYILYSYWLLENPQRDDLKSFLIRLKKEWYNERVIAKILNKLIKKFNPMLNIEDIIQKNIMCWIA